MPVVGMKSMRLLLVLMIACGWLSASPSPDETVPNKGEWNFKLRELWSFEDVGDQILTQIAGIQLAEDGRIYVVEPKRYRILILDSAGELIGSVGKKGEGPGEFRMVWDVQLSPGQMIVPGMNRVHIFTRGGRFIESLPLRSGVFPRIWLDDTHFVTVGSLERTGVKSEILKIVHLRDQSARKLVEVPAGKEMRASAGGVHLRVRDLRTNPSLIIGQAGKRIYYGFSDKYRIQSIDPEGNHGPILALKNRRRRPISMAAKRRRFEKMIFNGGPMPKEMVDQMVRQIPDECTYYHRFHVDPAGRIWVFVTDMENESGREVDIFSPDGSYLWNGEIRLPVGLRFGAEPAFGGSFMVAYVEDEEGEGRLVKYALNLPE